MNRGCLPFEGRSDLIVGFDEPIDGLTDLVGRGETGTAKRLTHQDGEKPTTAFWEAICRAGAASLTALAATG